MRILFVSSRFAPFTGGAESLVEDLARGFAAGGHRVTVATERVGGELARRESRDGFDVVRLDYPERSLASPGALLRLPLRGVRFVRAVGRLLRDPPVDVVCVGLAGIELLPLLFWRRRRRFRLVVQLHGGELRRYAKVSPLLRRALRSALRRCDAAVAVSAALAAEAAAFEPAVSRRLVVIENGVDLPLFRDAAPHAALRPFALFAGRLEPVKDPATLLAGFALAARQLPDLDLVIAGEGPLTEPLLRRATELGLGSRVRFVGAVPRAAVAEYLAGCELALLASTSEASPLFLIEARAAGRMTVGSRVPGIAERIEPGITGDLFPAGDAAALAGRLIEWHRDPEGRRRVEARLRAAPPRSIDAVRAEHLAVCAGERVPLSIGIVSSFFYRDDDNSGLSSHYFTLSRSLVELGHRVRLVTSPESLAGVDAGGVELFAVGVERRRLVPAAGEKTPPGGLRRAISRLRFAWQAWRRVRRLDGEERFDVVVAPELFAPGIFLALAMPERLVTRLHTPTELGDRFNRPGRPRLATRLASLPERWQARRSRGLSAATPLLRDAVARGWHLAPERIRVIPNGVRVEWVREVAAGEPREIAEDYLLYFGRLERRKGVHRLTEALAQVLPRHAGMRAIYAGRDWGLREEILASPLARSGRLTLFDTLDRPRLFGLVRHARLVVLPSLFENAPNAALEAMALGRPVLATRGAGFDELIEDGVSGFLVEPDDGAALARGIEAALAREDLGVIGERGLASVRRFEALTVARRQAAFFRELSV